VAAGRVIVWRRGHLRHGRHGHDGERRLGVLWEEGVGL